MARYGLIGKDIGYSFSKAFFTIKFEREKRKDSYHNFDIDTVENLHDILKEYPDLKGFNVTTPYKEAIIPLLSRLDKEAKEIGAVNTVKIKKDGSLIGYNTDHYGFAKALVDFLPLHEKTALILGTGGASKAVSYVLKIMGFEITFVSRNESDNTIGYHEIDRNIMSDNCLIVNCTPLGTSPDISACPNIPYQLLSSDHLLFDLVYNPRETEFMKRGFTQGARVTNGFKMLEFQAKRAWKIWNA